MGKRICILLIFLFQLLLPLWLSAQYVDLLWERIAHYPISNGADDISGYNNHGLVSGATPSADRWGNPNQAYYLDGLDDRIFCGYALEPISSAVTVTCWVRTDDASDYAHLISRYDFTADRGFILGTQDGQLKWSGRIGSGQFITMSSVSRIDDNQWHHVMGVIEGSTWSVYVDGTLENQIETGWLQTELHCSEPLTIGMYHRGDGGNHRHFKGYIDGVIIYRRALNACEIEMLYRGEVYPAR
jgi:hypothetical protein